MTAPPVTARPYADRRPRRPAATEPGRPGRPPATTNARSCPCPSRARSTWQKATPSARTTCPTASSAPPTRPTSAASASATATHVLDLSALPSALPAAIHPHAELLAAPTLNPLLAAGRPVWQQIRAAVHSAVTDLAHRDDSGAAAPPAGRGHAAPPLRGRRLRRLLRQRAPRHQRRPDLPPGRRRADPQLEAPADRLPRPGGHRRRHRHPGRPAPGPAQGPADEPRRVFGPSVAPRHRGRGRLRRRHALRRWHDPVALDAFRDHVFGVCLLNDWSARDIQAWEYVPLGPFLGKSFATSVSAWITPLDALDAARTPPPARDVPLLPYLDDAARSRAASTSGSSRDQRPHRLPSRRSPPCTGRPPSSSPI